MGGEILVYDPLWLTLIARLWPIEGGWEVEFIDQFQQPLSDRHRRTYPDRDKAVAAIRRHAGSGPDFIFKPPL